MPKPQKKPKQLRLELDSGSFRVSGTPILDLTAFFVERHRKLFEAGEEWALIDAVDLCAMGGMAMPTWLAGAFHERYMNWYLYKVKMLDKAFGVERKGFRREDRARREWLRPRIEFRVLQLHAEGMPIDEQLFAVIAAEFKKQKIKGAGKTTVSNIYYESQKKSWLRVAGAPLKTSK